MSPRDLSLEEFRECLKAYADEYKSLEITEAEYRSKLRGLGLNPSEIDHEVLTNRRTLPWDKS